MEKQSTIYILYFIFYILYFIFYIYEAGDLRRSEMLFLGVMKNGLVI